MTAAQHEARTYRYEGPVVYHVNRSEPQPKSDMAITIMAAISTATGITPEQMRSMSRKRDIIEARAIAVSLIRYHVGCTYSDIGAMFNRDHTTALHSHKSAKVWIDVDDRFVNKFYSVVEQLQ